MRRNFNSGKDHERNAVMHTLPWSFANNETNTTIVTATFFCFVLNPPRRKPALSIPEELVIQSELSPVVEQVIHHPESDGV